MDHNLNTIKKGIISVVFLTVCLIIVLATPPIPESYWGYATLNGVPASYDISITVEVNATGEIVGNTTVQFPDGGYSLDIIFDNPDTPEDEGANEGDLLTWKINGTACSYPNPETDLATSGGSNNNFNLTVASVNIPPTADLNGPYIGIQGVPIIFNGSGSYDPDGSIISYAWDFGDGNTGTETNPGHTYTQGGIFTVSLTITDDDGATDTATTTATIGGIPLLSPTLNGPDSIDIDGNYTLNWSSVSGATSYVLEEDISSSFSSPAEVYSGPDISKDFTGKTAKTYYYHVRACNEYGCSEWSNVVEIDLSDFVSVIVNAPESVSDTFDVMIDIVEVSNFYGAQFDLSFDSDIINVLEVDDGSISGVRIPIQGWNLTDENTIRVLILFDDFSGISGSGSLATIHFVVTGTVGDVSDINISNGLLVDIEAKGIPAIWIGDEVTV